MDFGKLSNVDYVNFSLPPLDDKTKSLFSTSSSKDSAKFYIGAPVWGVKSWLGKIYPEGTKPKDYLFHYSRQFNTIELNTTHYRIPTLEVASRWYQSVPSDFKFCPKFPKEISHLHMLRGVEKLAENFYKSLWPLKENLGVSFLQLPPSFSIQDGALLKTFISNMPRDFKLAIEFRHPSWFFNQSIHPKVFDYLSSQGVGTVITDVAGNRNVLHLSLTNKTLFVRFVGNELHKSDFLRIDDWVEVIKKLLSDGLDTVYFFIHQPGDTLIPELVTYFIDRLTQSLRIKIEKPQPQSAPPQQIDLL